jgi:hypothetical protein
MGLGEGGWSDGARTGQIKGLVYRRGQGRTAEHRS